MRKTIQISMQIGDTKGKYLILALCDDGTIWQVEGLYEGKIEWIPFPVPPDGIFTKKLRKSLNIA
jgi:hypothetical protein